MIPLLTLAMMGASLAKDYDNGQRRQAADDERLAQEREDREFAAGERRRLLKMRQDLGDATSPVVAKQTAQAGELTIGAAGPELASADTFSAGAGNNFATMGEAQAQATKANMPEGRMARMSSVLERHGELGKAQELRTGARQEELGGLQVQGAKQAWDDKAALRDMGAKLATGGWAAAPKLYEQYGDGRTMTLKQNGKGGASVAFINADGTQAHSQEFGSLPEFFSWASMRFDPAKWAQDEQQREQQRKTEARDERDFGLRKVLTMAQVAHMTAQNKREEALANKAMSQAGGGQNPAAPVWDKSADDFLMKRYTKADPVSGATAVDGAGLTFAKQIALAQAMRNGGDTTSALGYAFEVDAQLARDAGNDPAKHNAARQALLQSLRGTPKGQPGAAAVPQGAQTAVQAGKPAASQPTTAPATAKKTYTYGLMSGPRVSYLSQQKANGTASAAELDELAQLLATKDKAWFRGKASEAVQME